MSWLRPCYGLSLFTRFLWSGSVRFALSPCSYCEIPVRHFLVLIVILYCMFFLGRSNCTTRRKLHWVTGKVLVYDSPFPILMIFLGSFLSGWHQSLDITAWHGVTRYWLRARRRPRGQNDTTQFFFINTLAIHSHQTSTQAPSSHSVMLGREIIMATHDDSHQPHLAALHMACETSAGTVPQIGLGP